MGKKYDKETFEKENYVNEYKYALKKMKVYFLIDSENVTAESFSELSFIDKKHTMYFMNTKNSNCIHPNIVAKIVNCKCKKIFEDTLLENPYPNALDFKIVARAMHILNTKRDSYVVIVSRDRGFDSAIDYIREIMGIEAIRREETIHNPFVDFSMLKLSSNDIHKYKRNF